MSLLDVLLGRARVRVEKAKAAKVVKAAKERIFNEE